MKYQVTVAGRSFEIEVDHDRLVRVDGRPLYVDLEQVGGLPVYSLAVDDHGYVIFVEKGQDDYQVEVQGQVYPVEVAPKRPRLKPRPAACAEDGSDCLAIEAPLAGFLVALPVAAGQRVEAGQVVAVLESMKMQMELKSPQAGIVEAVHGPAQRDVGQGEALVILRPRPDGSRLESPDSETPSRLTSSPNSSTIETTG
jgi:biotin carboxyl carrier protein